MATVNQRKDGDGNKVYEVVFSIRENQWRRTCPSRVAANLKSKEVDAKLARIKLGTLTPPIELDKKQLGEWLWSGEVKTQTTDAKSLPTVKDLINGYLTSSFFTDKALVTQRVEKLKTKHLLRLLGEKTLLQTLTEASLQKYIDSRKTEDGKRRKNSEKSERKVVGKTIKKELDILRAIWNGYGLQQRVVDKNWASRFPLKVKYGKMTAKAPAKTLDECTDNYESVYLEADGLKEFLAHCKERQSEVADIYKWGYPAICYCAYTSFRRSTMITQEVSMVNFAKNELVGWVGKEDSSMDRTPRPVPMLPTLPDILREWLDTHHVGGKYLFGCYPDVMITDSQAWRCWCKYVKGTKWDKIEGQWHILRHSFVSICFERGKDENFVKRFTGHHSEAVARIYRHGSTAMLGEKMADLFE